MYQFLLDSENCTYSPVPVAESSAESFSDIPASVLSKLNLTAARSCCNGSATESCPDSPSGTMSAPLMESRGADSSMSSAGAFHAKTSARPARAKESQEPALASGQISPGSLAKYDPQECSWKTHQYSLLGGLESFSETWPRWGTMRSGELFLLPIPSGLAEHRAWITCVSESGYWQRMETPTKQDVSDRTPSENFRLTITGRSRYLNAEGAESQERLCQQVKRLPTLHGFSKDGLSNGPSGNELGRAVNRMPTAQASDNRDRGGLDSPCIQRRIAKGKQISLSMTVKRMGAPRNSDGMKHPLRELTPDHDCRSRMEDQIAQEEGPGGSLNPPWVEWLMNWPEEWTSINPMSHVKYIVWVMASLVYEEEDRRIEILRVLRIGNASQEIQRALGRPISISEAAVLFALVCEHEERPNEARVFVACSEILEGEMRGVRTCQQIAGTSLGSEFQEQRSEEYPDLVQVLPRFLAYYGQAAWMGYSREPGTPRVASGVDNRVDRLAALGNGQVPAVAALAWRILSEGK